MFEVGQEVVCIKSHPEGVVKKGLIYTIRAIGECGCGLQLDVGFIHPDGGKWITLCCLDCDKEGVLGDSTWWLKSNRFIPLDEITAIEVLDEVQQITLPNLEELILIEEACE